MAISVVIEVKSVPSSLFIKVRIVYFAPKIFCEPRKVGNDIRLTMNRIFAGYWYSLWKCESPAWTVTSRMSDSVYIKRCDVTFGPADKLVDDHCLDTEVRLCRSQCSSHEPLEGWRHHPELLAAVFRHANLERRRREKLSFFFYNYQEKPFPLISCRYLNSRCELQFLRIDGDPLNELVAEVVIPTVPAANGQFAHQTEVHNAVSVHRFSSRLRTSLISKRHKRARRSIGIFVKESEIPEQRNTRY